MFGREVSLRALRARRSESERGERAVPSKGPTGRRAEIEPGRAATGSFDDWTVAPDIGDTGGLAGIRAGKSVRWKKTTRIWKRRGRRRRRISCGTDRSAVVDFHGVAVSFAERRRD